MLDVWRTHNIPSTEKYEGVMIIVIVLRCSFVHHAPVVVTTSSCTTDNLNQEISDRRWLGDSIEMNSKSVSKWCFKQPQKAVSFNIGPGFHPLFLLEVSQLFDFPCGAISSKNGLFTWHTPSTTWNCTMEHGNSTANLPSWGFSPVRGSSTSGSHLGDSPRAEICQVFIMNHASWTLKIVQLLFSGPWLWYSCLQTLPEAQRIEDKTKNAKRETASNTGIYCEMCTSKANS